MTTIWEYLEKHDLTDTVCEGLDKLNINSDKIDDVMSAMGRFQLVINHRAKSRFGQFDPRGRTIELTSEYFVGDWDERKADHNNTLLHEVAHLVVHFAYKPEDGNTKFRMTRAGMRRTRIVQAHGMEWKAVMRAFGLAPERCGKSDILTPAKKRVAKHLYTCVKCGYEHRTQRELKNMDRRYHAKCGGKLSHQRLAA